VRELRQLPQIDDLPLQGQLKKLAEQNVTTQLGPACEAFCDGWFKTFPKMGDAYYYRAHVRQRLGNAAGARADYENAVRLGTNFPAEAQTGVAIRVAETTRHAGPAPQPEAAAPSDSIAAQVVSKGVFAAKAPAGVSEVAWRGVLQNGATRSSAGRCSRRTRKCAVTGSDAEPPWRSRGSTGRAVGIPNAIPMRPTCGRSST